jgi:acetyl-CoA carboxylase carboxyl transferase subunit alpha
MGHEFDFEKPIIEIEKMIEKLKKLSQDSSEDFTGQIAELEAKCRERKQDVYAHLTAWQTVQMARHPERPVLQDYIPLICSEFIELHGDRAYGDDRGLIGGFATIDKYRVMLIGNNKGRNVEDNLKRNFGMANPEGYRKALRLMRLAEKYDLPVVCLVDTPAAFPGKEAEERGQHEAIARNLVEMARLPVPIVAVVTGEGGSGGALGIAVGDVVCMLSHAIYSVAPPETCGAILWRDSSFAPQAAEALKITAPSLLELGVIDEIIEEPLGGAHHDAKAAAERVKETLVKHLKRLKGVAASKLVAKRFEKFSGMGKFAK